MRWRSVLRCILCFLLLSVIPCAALATISTVHTGEDLQAAIDSASPGDTLQVETGTYSGNFRVATPITLKGIGMPVLDGGHSLNKDTITLLADGIQLEGFVITGSARAGINVSSRDNVIRVNEIVYNEQFGISVWAPGNLIEENNCSETSGSLRNGIGVYLSSAPETRVINNTVLSSGKNGIQISHSSYLLLEGNRISTIGGRSGGGHGIRLENSAFVVLRHNQIQNCLTDSLYLYNASHSVFQDLVLDNTTTGITLRGTDNATFDRITVQNNRVGMDISSSGSVLINRVFRSTFVSNTHHLISTDSAVEWNSTLPLPYRYEGWYQENYTGNYWDTYPYEDSDGDGIGDQAYVLSAADTDFYPLIVPFTAFEWDPDVTPPGTILNLTGYSPDPTTFCWNWQDPPDQDLDHLMVYLNGTFLLNLSAGEQTLTVDGLFPSTEYTLGIVTVDTSGNRNPDWINHTGTTCSLPDPSPSPTETVTPIPTDTEIPTVTIPPTSSHTASIPTSRAVTHRRNTRYIPPPSTYPPTTNTVSPAIEEEYPSLPSEADNTVSAPESTAVPGDIIPPWTVQIPASAVALPLLVVAVSGYLLRRKKK